MWCHSIVQGICSRPNRTASSWKHMLCCTVNSVVDVQLCVLPAGHQWMSFLRGNHLTSTPPPATLRAIHATGARGSSYTAWIVARSTS
jgi:hypothetical protein